MVQLAAVSHMTPFIERLEGELASKVAKSYRQNTERAAHPRDTWVRITGIFDDLGITRVADITCLDRVGLPVYSSIRPSAAPGSLCVHAGKGVTHDEARVSAAMEAIEYAWSEVGRHEPRIVRTCERELRRRGDLLSPEVCLMRRDAVYDIGMELAWVEGFALDSLSPVYAPAQLAFFPCPETGNADIFAPSTNGVASGNCMVEAILHATTEVIERDAISLVMAGAKARAIDRATLPERLLRLVTAMELGGMDVHLTDITSDIGISCISAVTVDRNDENAAYVNQGTGCHLDPAIAVLRALTEAAQSRLSFIHGARDDLVETYDKFQFAGIDRDGQIQKMKQFLVGTGAGIAFASLKNLAGSDFRSDFQTVLARLQEAGLTQLICVPLTPINYPVCAVRVIVPGLEHYFEKCGRGGGRLKRQLISQFYA